MRHPFLLFSLTAIALVAACESSKPKAVPASYTPATFTEQVSLGQTLFGQHCAECHGDSGQGDKGPRLVGLKEGALPLEPPASRKVRKTRFVTVADVAEFVVANMPPKKAGTLTQEEYLSVLAFDLKANGIDLGRERLTMAKAKELVIQR
jgi:S-disulfanyl-L-cysteine oxidoreductase SoxD